jgi:hypothetical protein
MIKRSDMINTLQDWSFITTRLLIRSLIIAALAHRVSTGKWTLSIYGCLVCGGILQVLRGSAVAK